MTQAPPNILVVDDTLENLRLLANLLGGHGYEVRPVTNGRQAIQAAQHDPPDLILLDVNMPEMDGYEVCERLKTIDVVRDVPVIFLTALTDTADKVRAFDAGAVDYVTKPFQFEEVLARVRTHIALRHAQQELGRNFDRLRALENVRDQLVHMVVHDMRSPLMALVMNLEFMRDAMKDRLDPQSLDDINESIRAAGTLTGMANALLDVSRLEEGKLPLKRSRTDLGVVARAAADRLAGMARSRSIDLSIVETFVDCDGDLVQRVVENLLSNAIKHTQPEGRVWISVGPAADGTSGRVAIRDEGPGVPPEARTKIFEKFGAVEAREENTYHSVGLGLAFSKLAVEAHGGAIGVDAGVPKGSEFWFTLPALAN
jgi:signal transduction histidine kinase